MKTDNIHIQIAVKDDLEEILRLQKQAFITEVEKLNPQAKEFQLFTAASSTHNIRLYESVGYRICREYEDPAQNGILMVEMMKNNIPPFNHNTSRLFPG